MSKALIVGLVLFGLLVVAFAVIGVLYITRGTPVTHVRAIGDADGPPAVSDTSFRRTLELLARLELVEGNEVDLLLNGETYGRLWSDLRAARQSITLQLYYLNPGMLADTLKGILLERAQAGVKVLFLADAFGGSGMPDEYFEELEAGGVTVAKFRPPQWWKLDKVAHRSHIRVVVVDGAIGYTGGFGLDDKWIGDGRTRGWRDTNVRFRGPAVMQLQATFAAGWAEATGTLLLGEMFFPSDEFEPTEGEYYAGVLHMAPTIGSTAAERFLAVAISGARRTLYITAAYFVPDDDFRRMLCTAVERGVDVRILAASEKTDVPITRHAGRSNFEQLLGAGVRIWEYTPTMVHAKTMVIDGVFSSVGTMNFDNRSLAFNDETNLVALDRRLAERLEAVFLEDLAYAKEITLEEFRRRPFGDKAKEQFARLASRVL